MTGRLGPTTTVLAVYTRSSTTSALIINKEVSLQKWKTSPEQLIHQIPNLWNVCMVIQFWHLRRQEILQKLLDLMLNIKSGKITVWNYGHLPTGLGFVTVTKLEWRWAGLICGPLFSQLLWIILHMETPYSHITTSPTTSNPLHLLISYEILACSTLFVFYETDEPKSMGIHSIHPKQVSWKCPN